MMISPAILAMAFPVSGSAPIRPAVACGRQRQRSQASRQSRRDRARCGQRPEPGRAAMLSGPSLVTTTDATLARRAPVSRLLDREFLAAPVIHALGQLHSVESLCAQHAGGGG